MTPCAYCQDGQPANCECQELKATMQADIDNIRRLMDERDKWRKLATDAVETICGIDPFKSLDCTGELADRLQELEGKQ